MGKKRGNHSGGLAGAPASLREEATGFKPTAARSGYARNPRTMAKLQHLQNLAVWAAGEGSIPSQGAFFGRRLATVAESLGVPPDPSLFSCQRCETILQPGYNCTIRVEKNRANARHRCKKSSTPTQNNVVYTCHFCSHRNMKRGAPRGHLKDMYPTKSKPCPRVKTQKSADQIPVNSTSKIQAIYEISEIGSPIVKGKEESPTTPLIKLLDAKRRKRNRPGSKKPAEPQSADVPASTGAVSSKRRRKSWSSLKEIAESNECNRNITHLKIPFVLKLEKITC
ncbi:hypothetical protein SAY87_015236 [Trapa incisa]|uniref:Uncharacterized protein n=1 Tax=Trapa incisa TaxID=236973 RepID=A0AAN7GZ02_9MYRT|nr:hypothetical protein SAY87_015236 [Trapa incisa]